MIGITTGIGGINKLMGNPLGSIGGDLLGGIGGAIGSVFGGGRKAKRDARQKYWDALKQAGVNWNYIKRWHSDENQAGQALVNIIQKGGVDGVNFINKNLRGQVTRNKTRALEADFDRYLQDQKNKSNAGKKGAGSNGYVTGSGMDIKKLGMLAGAGFAVKKFLLD